MSRYLPPFLTCGHRANGHKTGTLVPVCVICTCEEIAPEPDLTDRVAECVYCGREHASDRRLAFFKLNRNPGPDSYYCGCSGWD